MLKAGNRVHFEPGNCYVEHIASGRRTKIEEKEGTYEIGVWIPNVPARARAPNPSASVHPGNAKPVVLHNRFDALVENDSDHDMGFVWQE